MALALSPAAQDAMELLRQGRVDDALRVLQEGLAKDPKDLACLVNLARAHLAQSTNEAARPVLERVLEVDPRQSEARSHLARFKAEAGDRQTLQTLRELAAAQGAGFPEQFNLAVVLLALGDNGGAEAALERAVSIEPNSPYAYYELGRLALNRSDPRTALKWLERTVELAPREHRPLWLKARAHAALGDVGLALETVELALTRAPSDPELLDDMTKYCLAVGDRKSVV